jgi:sugar transferase (PEP-CTERM system associated)
MLRIFRHYVPATLFVLIASDVSVILLAVRLSSDLAQWMGEGSVWPKTALLTLLIVFALYLADLYNPRLQPGRGELAARLLLALVPAALLAAALAFAVPAFRFGRFAFVLICGLVIPGLFLSRTAWARIHRAEPLRERVLVMGVSRAAESILELQSTGARPFTALGFLDDSPDAHDRLPPGAELLGKSKDLLSIVEELHPDCVIVALAEMRGAFPAKDLLECRLRGIRVEDWPTFYEKQTGKILLAELRPSWLIFSDGFVKTQLTQMHKRALDAVLASVGLLLSLPLMGLIALAIKLDSRGPVLFSQDRVGQKGRLFTLYKFRSMDSDAERDSGPVWASPDDPRVTRVGRILRTTRLDELPQLFNVLAGHMSFIGPRPERPEFVRTLLGQSPFYMQRLSVKPGITGWAQVRYQYASSLDDSVEKLQYDLYYIKNLSPFLDLLILLHTIQVVLLARGSR